MILSHNCSLFPPVRRVSSDMIWIGIHLRQTLIWFGITAGSHDENPVLEVGFKLSWWWMRNQSEVQMYHVVRISIWRRLNFWTIEIDWQLTAKSCSRQIQCDLRYIKISGIRHKLWSYQVGLDHWEDHLGEDQHVAGLEVGDDHLYCCGPGCVDGWGAGLRSS